MKLLVNTSNLVIGGAIQVAISLIDEFSKGNNEMDYVIVCSKQIANQINSKKYPDNFKFYELSKSPASLKTRTKIVKELKAIEKAERPDVVFSVFGPSYWTPQSPHLMGFALGLITNPDSLFYKKISIKDKIYFFLLNHYQKYYVLKNSKEFWCETEDVKAKMVKYLGLIEHHVHVVGNTHASFYTGYYDRDFVLPTKKNNEFRLITISANYLHKNLSVINQVAKILKEKGVNVTFYLTLPEAEFNAMFTNAQEQGIVNLGVVSAKDCPFIYEQCDALFLPTLVESFTASYPEAMIMEKPILTSDLSFARDTCNDAALYFNPVDPVHISEKIIELMTQDTLRKTLINNGLKRVASFPSSSRRAEMITTILMELAKKRNN